MYPPLGNLSITSSRQDDHSNFLPFSAGRPVDSISRPADTYSPYSAGVSVARTSPPKVRAVCEKFHQEPVAAKAVSFLATVWINRRRTGCFRRQLAWKIILNSWDQRKSQNENAIRGTSSFALSLEITCPRINWAHGLSSEELLSNVTYRVRTIFFDARGKNWFHTSSAQFYEDFPKSHFFPWLRRHRSKLSDWKTGMPLCILKSIFGSKRLVPDNVILAKFLHNGNMNHIL